MRALSWPASQSEHVLARISTVSYSVAGNQKPASSTHRVLGRGKGVVAQAVDDEGNSIAVSDDGFFTAFQGGAHGIVNSAGSGQYE